MVGDCGMHIKDDVVHHDVSFSCAIVFMYGMLLITLSILVILIMIIPKKTYTVFFPHNIFMCVWLCQRTGFCLYLCVY